MDLLTEKEEKNIKKEKRDKKQGRGGNERGEQTPARGAIDRSVEGEQGRGRGELEEMWRRRLGALLLRSSSSPPSCQRQRRHHLLLGEVTCGLFFSHPIPSLPSCKHCAQHLVKHLLKIDVLELCKPLLVRDGRIQFVPALSFPLKEPLALNHLVRLFTSQAGGGSGNFQKPFIAFVLGGPGSGKGTQCTKIASNFGFTHLSAGDLLRHEISSGSEKGESILEIIKEGRIVPSEITVELIRKAMELSNAKRILIDGFPRCEENRIAFERIIGSEPEVVIFFDCPEDEMVKRLLGRNQGRVDDNIETIKKRLKVFESLNIPVVDYYSSKGKVHKINAMGTADEIFEAVRKLFSSLSSNKLGYHEVTVLEGRPG
ncbi:hypothetical protein EJB05_46881, partial [Eragrostis curvula]